MAQQPPSSDSLMPTYVRLTLMALMWAGTFVAGRTLAGVLEPLPAAIGRFGLALAALLVLSWRKEGGLPRLSGRQVLVTVALGATGVFLYNLFFLRALTEMPASRTAIFVAFNPILVALIMATAFGERLARGQWLGIGLALSGAAVVISRGDVIAMLRDLSSAFGLGEVAMITAIVSWALYTIIGKKALTDLSPLAATTYATLWGFVMLVLMQVVSPAQGIAQGLTPGSLTAIAYLAILGTVVPFVWYYQGVKLLGPARTSVFTNLVPVFGVALGVVLLGEPLSLSMLLGGAMVIGGVTLTNRQRAADVRQ